MALKNTTKMKTGPVTGGLQNISPKTMVMIALLAVMGILWGRVLLRGKSGPASASAAETDALQQTAQNDLPASVRIKPVSLPFLSGRNDTLSGDLFSAENWQAFDSKRKGQTPGVKVDASEDSVERTLRLKLEKISKSLVLEAVIQDADGNPSQAFVDGKILSVGQTLTVQEGPDRYVLTLKKITENDVTFSWNKISIVLEMAEAFEI